MAGIGSADQTHQHPPDLDQLRLVPNELFATNPSCIRSELKVVLELARRRDRHLEEAREVPVARATRAMYDVRGDRNSRTADLTDKLGVVAARDCFDQLLDLDRDRVRPLPYQQASEVVHVRQRRRRTAKSFTAALQPVSLRCI
jgi:hypothetical protein